MTPLLDAALQYALYGWPVFPVHTPIDGGCSCGNPTCTQPGKHPRTEHGLNDATLDPDQIRSWWTRWPDANIGLRTGIAFDVLDVDSDEAARALAVCADIANEDPDTVWVGGPMAWTGRGHHTYYAITGSGNAAALFGIKGVDWRGAGGYVIAPPSLHHTGVHYRWADTNPPHYELEPAPIFLVAKLLNLHAQVAPVRRGQPRGIIAGLVDKVAREPEGKRNHVLNWAAHTLGMHVHNGEISDDDGRQGCDQLYDAAMRCGLSDAEAKATIKSGWQAGRSGVRKAAS